MGLFDSILDFAGSDAGKAAIGIGGSLIGSGMASSAAEKAAGMQTAATQEAIAEQARQFDITQSQMAPFIDSATRAVIAQQAGAGLLGPEAEQMFMQDFQESPAQKYMREQGEQAIIRQSAATGGLGGARVQEALQAQGMGLASQNVTERMNRLAAMAGSGQTAATNLGGLRGSMAGQTAQMLSNQGTAGAAGVLGQNAAMQQGISGVTQSLGGLF